MNVKTLVCNCKGFDPFRFADMNARPVEIDVEPAAAFDGVSAQVLAEGGNQILQDVLQSAEDDADTYVMVCACQEETQKKLFLKTLPNGEFDPESVTPSDFLNSAHDGFLSRIHERLNGIAEPGPEN
jgi:hypothetical protein